MSARAVAPPRGRRAGRIAALLALALGSAGPAAAGAVPTLIDAFGNAIGPVFGPSVVLLVLGGQVVRVPFTEAGFAYDEPYRLYFEAADCSGQAHLAVELLPPLARFDRSAAPGVYVLTPGPTRRALSAGSQRWGNDPASACEPLAAPVTVAPALRAVYGPLFQPPFGVQLR